MILAGDELGRTQRGNNNSYCQDNPISWLDWNLDAEQLELLDFVKSLIRLRRRHALFRRRSFFEGRFDPRSGVKDIIWLNINGKEMSGPEWHSPSVRALGVFMGGGAIPEQDAKGRDLVDDDFLMLFNAGGEEVSFIVPVLGKTAKWRLVFDTGVGAVGETERHFVEADGSLQLVGNSMLLLSGIGEVGRKRGPER